MSNRRPKHIVTLLLLVSAIFVSISYLNGPQPVSAIVTLTLTPNQGQPGQTITFSTTALPGTPTTCSVSGTVVGTSSCTIQAGPIATGSFDVKSVAPGPYTVTVTSSPGGGSAQATFQVVHPALNNPVPPSGPPGTSVTITNSSSFASSDTTCSVSGSPVNNGACAINSVTHVVTATFVVKNIAPATYVITVSGSPIGDSAQTLFTVTAQLNITVRPPQGPPSTQVIVNGTISPADTTCSISGTPVTQGSCALTGNPGTGQFNSTFVVGNVAAGPYTITVSGNTGDSVKAIFTVTSPTITLSPGSGTIGALVVVNGTGFSFKDNTCTISSSQGNFIKNPACSISPSTGKPSGSFTVGNVAIGSYVVRVTGNTGDFAEKTFHVVSGPAITLSPASGAIGIQVMFNGTGFLPADTTCTVSGTPVQNGACSIASGSGAPSGTFFVKNVAPGTYTITVSGNGGDSAQKTFVVTTGPTISLSPGSGGIGILVIVNGTGFLPTDNHCTISGTGGVVTSAACLINLGSGTPSGTFIVGNVVPGSYVITLSATPGGDSAQATFIVTTGPSITLTPSFGPPGSSVSVTGTAFSTSDHSCTITGASGVVLSQSCTITAGSKTPTGSFVVGFVVPGSYLITLTGNTGDSASAVFRVTNVTKTLTLFPAKAPNGATVTFRATGFNSTDTSCSVETNNPGHNNLLITSPTCSMSSTVATGSFVVGPFATEDINWNVTVRGLPQNDIPAFAFFNVTATIVISPTEGNVGTVFSFTGSGFESTAVECTTLSKIQPAFTGGFSSPLGTFGGCGLNGSTGQLTGSFTPPPGTIAGVYVLVITDNTGSSASGSFTIGTPSAQLTVSPNIVSAPGGGPAVSVSVTGSGFNAGDTTCTLTSVSAPPLFTVSSCQISGGSVSGSFAVSSSAVPGLYLITVTGSPAGDFASNFLEVATVTSVTSTSFTTTTSTTATSTTTLTTFTSISSSLTTTTITSTGPTTIVFQQGTQTTISAVTTTTSTTTGFTASPTTQTTTTLQTVTFGQILQPGVSDELGLLGMLLLVAPAVLRRLLK